MRPRDLPPRTVFRLQEITAAIQADDKQSVRQAFRALVSYPHDGRIEASSPGMLVVTLNRVSAHLASDGALMPPGTCEALGLSPGSSYAAGVTEAYRERTRLSRQIIDRFAT